MILILTSMESGANPSSEDADEALEDGATQVNNVVYSFRLQSTSFDKKSYLTYLKVCSGAIGPDLQGIHSWFRVTWRKSKTIYRQSILTVWSLLRKTRPLLQKKLSQISKIMNLWEVSYLSAPTRLNDNNSTPVRAWTLTVWWHCLITGYVRVHVLQSMPYWQCRIGGWRHP